MSMFCYQCQETAKNTGCDVKGVCGKQPDTAKLQDVLIYILKGISIWHEKAKELGIEDKESGLFVAQGLFATITNANFDDDRLLEMIEKAIAIRKELSDKVSAKCKAKTCCDDSNCGGTYHDSAIWTPVSKEQMLATEKVGILATENEDIRSLRELIIYGIKGMSAYADHAAILGYTDDTIWDFIMEALVATTKDLTVDELVAMTLKTGEFAVTAMALLDKANTETYGHPELTEVNIGVGKKPGILISGHDLLDLKELLEQTKGTGVDVYTHGEMLPAHYYPEFKKYDNFFGNYGNAWWQQNAEFASFNGAILMTTNCITPVKDSYKDRIFTTGLTGFPGVKHIADRDNGKQKDFSAIIALAKTLPAPKEIETGKIVGGFARNQVIALADKVVAAVKSGAVKRFVVMAGCDGRHKSRQYFTDVANELPKDAIILTAGCAKYRYNKLELGDIGGIPRVLDAGQCNDSYSLAVIALKLMEVFELKDINDLPLSFDIAWYEQKAVTVLLALLHLGVKKIHLGPTLPGFLSPNVAKVIIDAFDLRGTTDAKTDVATIMSGK